MKRPNPKTWLFPAAIERDYKKDLKQYAKHINSTISRVLSLRQDNADTDQWRAHMLRVLMDLPQQFELDFERNIGISVKAYSEKIAHFNDAQFHNVVKSVVGMDFAMPEPWLQRELDNWTAENTRLIKSLSAQQIAKVSNIISQAAINGTSIADLKQQLLAIEKFPINHAELIASDQVGKLNSQLTRMRQQAIGVKQYRWRGKLDERERESHLRREGKIFDWDNPPSGGHAGTEIRCRCYAEMILPELSELNAQFFGDGGNRHYNAQMLKRGLTPETDGAAIYTNPYAQYGYLPRGGVMPAIAQQVITAQSAAQTVRDWVAQGVVTEAAAAQIAEMVGVKTAQSVATVENAASVQQMPAATMSIEAQQAALSNIGYKESFDGDKIFDVSGNVASIVQEYQLTHYEIVNLQNYTGNTHHALNRYLRGGKTDESMLVYYQTIADLLSSALSKLPKYVGQVVRDVDLPENLTRNWVVNDIWQPKEFLSSTLNNSHDEYRNVRLVIQSKTGRHIEALSLFTAEREVLFDRNSQFQITKIERLDNGRLEVHLTEIVK